MSDISIYRRYATAMLAIARQKGKGDVWLDQLKTLLEAFRERRELRAVLENRFFDLNKRKKIVDVLSERLAFDREVVDFIKYLIDRKRLACIDGIVRVFEEEVDADAGRVQVEVRSPRAVSPEIVQELGAVISDVLGKTPKLLPQIDKRLLGGLQLAWEGKLYDGSVSGQLERIQRKL